MDVAVDFVGTHPLGVSEHPLSLKNVGRHLRKAEASKVAGEAELCARARWGFQPASFNPWGGLGPGCASLLHEISSRATADLEGWPKARRQMEIH